KVKCQKIYRLLIDSVRKRPSKSDDFDCPNSLVSQINKLEINEFESEEAWYISFSQRKCYKLYSFGHCYTVEKPKQELFKDAKKIYWRCEDYPVCSGRGNSNGLIPHLKVTKSHIHPPNPEIKMKLKALEELKDLALKSTEPARTIIQNSQLKLEIQNMGEAIMLSL
ncbi:unnamed protein product, partial [Brachionus calyciflorus]